MGNTSCADAKRVWHREVRQHAASRSMERDEQAAQDGRQMDDRALQYAERSPLRRCQSLSSSSSRVLQVSATSTCQAAGVRL